MENNLPKRKTIRLKDFDYSSAGAYFITICTHNRKSTLSRIVGAIHESPEIQLTKYGEIVDRFIHAIPPQFTATIDKYVIMPNHIHLILIITNREEFRAIHESPLQGRSVISKIIGYIKMNASKEIHNRYGYSVVWQRGFHDHIIRDKRDYEKHVQYILENPSNWLLDELYSE